MKKTALLDINRPLAFMHIPKTAGTALSDAIVKSLCPKNVLLRIGRVLYGDFDDFDSFDESITPWLALDTSSFPETPDYVIGHLSNKEIKTAYPNAQMVTFLREPICRIMSLWLFWRSFTEDGIHLWGTYAPTILSARGTLEDFLSGSDVMAQLDNVFVRMLLSPHRLIPGSSEISEENDEDLLSEAHVALSEFSFVGLIEDPNLVNAFSSWTGRPMRLEIVNATRSPEGTTKTRLSDELTSAALQKLVHFSRLDIKLWTSVLQASSIKNHESFRETVIAKKFATFAELLT